MPWLTLLLEFFGFLCSELMAEAALPPYAPSLILRLRAMLGRGPEDREGWGVINTSLCWSLFGAGPSTVPSGSPGLL